jgi:iron complex outermembrane receptor protein
VRLIHSASTGEESMKNKTYVQSISFAAMATFLAAPALAQDNTANSDGVADIIVTANKTGESSVQRTPIAISAFSGEALADAHIVSTKDLGQIVPSLSVSQFSTYAQIYIRGVGSNNSFSGSDPSVTVHSDGVYLARPFAQFMTFLDVERVEVLRGPQGTLYGRNSAGGTINIISRTPGNDLKARFAASGGNYGLVDLGGYVSGPIVADKVQASLAASYVHHDDYRHNIVASGNDVDNENSRAIRGQLRLTLADGITATTRADYALSKQRIPGFSVLQTTFDPVTNSILGNYDKVALDLPQFSRTRIWGVSQELEFELGSNTTLKSLTAYRDSDSTSQQDGDATDQALLTVNLGERAKQFSQEFNLVGTIGQLDYVLGLFYFDEKDRTNSFLGQPARDLRATYRPYTHTRAYAGYVQGTYHFTDTLSLVAGARYSEEKKDFTQSIDRRFVSTNVALPFITYDASRKFNSFTPKVGLNWAPTPAILAYASVTRGFKSGGFNFNSANAAQGFNPETLWSYEAGLKTRLLNNKLLANFSLFRYDYKDLQVNAFISPGVNDIVNAATARVKGAEVELTAKPVNGFDLTANFAYLDAAYRKYPAAPIGGAATIDASGKRLNNAPKFTMNVAAQYEHELRGDLSAYVRGEYSRRSQTYFTVVNSPLIGQDAYGLVNAAVGIKSGKSWTFELWGRNLTKREYVLNVYTSGPVPSGIPGAPRTYGARLNWNY